MEPRLGRKPGGTKGVPPMPLPIGKRLSFFELLALLPEHVSKPAPDRVVRDWFNLTVQAAGVDSAGCVPVDALLSQWSIAAAPRKAIIEDHFAQHDRGKRGTITSDAFDRLADEMGFGEVAATLFDELPKLEDRSCRYSTLMIHIAARGASSEMKLFLTAMACRTPPKPVENGSSTKPIKRRVWRSGPRRLQPPTDSAISRRQLLTASHATDHPMRGRRAQAVADRWHEERWQRHQTMTARAALLADRTDGDLDVLVRARRPNSRHEPGVWPG